MSEKIENLPGDKVKDLLRKKATDGTWSKAASDAMGLDSKKPREINPEITHGEFISFGPHKGMPYTRLPIPYLKWLVNTNKLYHNAAHLARAELTRRGCIIERHCDISGHSLDRMSVDCFDLYLSYRNVNNGVIEGLHAWMHRVLSENIDWGSASKGSELLHAYDLTWVLRWGHAYPVLVTVMRNRDHKTFVCRSCLQRKDVVHMASEDWCTDCYDDHSEIGYERWGCSGREKFNG